MGVDVEFEALLTCVAGGGDDDIRLSGHITHIKRIERDRFEIGGREFLQNLHRFWALKSQQGDLPGTILHLGASMIVA